MSREEMKLSHLDVMSLGDSEDQTVAILAVGDSEEWLRQGNTMPGEGAVKFVSIEDVTQTLLEQICPTVVLSPALSTRFDCIDLAQILSEYSYKGRYRAVSRELPNPAMVEREIKHLCPKLDFGILISD